MAARQPPYQRGTRWDILMSLKRQGGATAAVLARTIGCSLNAVRYHLRELEAAGAVRHDRARHGVGAPAHVYQLSGDDNALFPDRYAGTVAHLLDRLVVLQGRKASAQMLQEHYASIGDRIRSQSAALSGEDRGASIARALDAEGFMATWEGGAHGGVLTEHHCPHRVVAERFPEICAAEEAFLRDAFGGEVTRRSHITEGCGTCSYHVAPADGAAEDRS
ncbi:MAG: helix-turn-helix transcriptional regulator [Gemmatimonadales bacterium]